MKRVETRRQFTVNMVSNIAMLLISSLVMLFFTPYLIHQLGLAVYGLVPLALSISTYMGVLTIGIQSAVGRYLTLEVTKGDAEAASKVMTTAVLANLAVALLIMPILLGVAIAAPSLFDVPAGQEVAARWFFSLAMISYVLVAMREVIGGAAFANNRIDLLNAARLAEPFVRLVFVVAVFALRGPDLVMVGAGMALGGLASLLVSVGAWKVTAGDVAMRPSFFDRSYLRSMLGTGGWVTVGHIGTLLHMATDLVVINILLGALIAGGYGSALQLSSFLRSFAGSLSGVIVPLLFAQYAREHIERLGVTALQAVKILGLAIGLPAALVMGLARPILGLWLGPEFVVLTPVLIALVFHLPYNYSSLPLNSVEMAFDRMKWPSLVGIVTGVLNVALSILLARVGGWAFGVAIATALSLTFRSGLFTPIHAAILLGRKRSAFFAPMSAGVLLSLLVGFGAYALELTFTIATWSALLAGAVAVGVAYTAAAWLVLNAEERRMILSLVPGVAR